MGSYGPQLPSHLVKSDDEEENSSEAQNIYGPVIPGHIENDVEEEEPTTSPQVFGPIIPVMTKNDEEEDPEEVIGPSIPSHVAPQIREEEEEEDDDYDANSYGPSLPSNFQPQAGPALPPQYDSDEEVGPMPVPKGSEEQEELARLYRLAMQKEAEEEEKNFVPKREEWMTSVPKTLGNIGLGARTFKTGTAVERDSTWEDAPGAKKKKTNEGKTLQSVGIAAADARKAAIVDKKAAGPSLLDLHQKKRNEKLAEQGYQPGERRPFDREKDMEVCGLKPGATKEAVNTMKEISSRFASSKDQRFL